MAVDGLLPERQINRLDQRLLVAVEPDDLALCGVLRGVPVRAVGEKRAGQHECAAASVFEVQVRLVPGEFLGFVGFYGLVPAEIAERERIGERPSISLAERFFTRTPRPAERIAVDVG